VDISAGRLDAAIGLEGRRLSVERNPAGIEALAAFCRSEHVDLVAMEATGGYERLPYVQLWAAGLACAIANPRQVRRFAEAMGRLEKTDAIDAGLIAGFAAAKRLRPTPPASAAQAELRALSDRLRQLSALGAAQAQQGRLIEDRALRQDCDALLALIARQSRAIEARLLALIEHDPLWRSLDQALRTIKGVAGRTVARLLAEMPEIGTLSGKAVAKLAGLAPIARQSGQSEGRRRIAGGREGVRSILVVIAVIAARHNADLKAFRDKLVQAGKPKMLARIALARKILVRLNAKARDARIALAAA
jgi:transposase